MSTTVRFLGVAGFEFESQDRRILVDPFLTGNHLAPCTPDELETPDVILVTHGAYDHYGDAAAIARRTGAPVVCGADVRLKLLDEGVPPEQVQVTVWGVLVEVAGIVIRPVECHHWSFVTLSDGRTVTGTPLAFIFETEPGVRIYHYGDTSYFDMRWIGELYRPTVALLGCTTPFELEEDEVGPGRILTGEMDPDEAARAAELLGVEHAIPCHFIAPTPDLDVFVERCRRHDSTGTRRVTVPVTGGTLTLEPRLDAELR
jgi:L-ascorbate metabolism protein UlaG (beta-lactamase superfamily)